MTGALYKQNPPSRNPASATDNVNIPLAQVTHYRDIYVNKVSNHGSYYKINILYIVPSQSGDIEYTLSVKGSHSFNDGPDESLLLPDSLVPCD